LSTGRRMAGESTLVTGFKIELNDRRAWCENHVLHQVTVSWERSDERPNELITEGFLPLHKHAWNLKYYIICVIGQNEILVRS